MALERVSSCRCRAAAASWLELSGGIGRILSAAGIGFGFQCGDDHLQVVGDLLVHLDQAGVSASSSSIFSSAATLATDEISSPLLIYSSRTPWVARPMRCLAQAASAMIPSGSKTTV